MDWIHDDKRHSHSSGDYRIEVIWFTPQESFDVYYKGQPIASSHTLEEAKSAAQEHAGHHAEDFPTD